jgi:hypothetical protein
MPRYLALRPFGNWLLDKGVALQNGVALGRLPEGLRPNFGHSGWGDFFSQRQIRYLGNTDYWLHYSFEDEEGPGSPGRARAVEVADNAALAFLVDCPAELNSGEFQEVTAVCERRGDDLLPVAVNLRQPYHSFSWARVVRFPYLWGNRIELIAEGIEQCIADRVVRLLNALRLLELGLQSTEPYIRLLLWAVGLDSLLMAITLENFVSRLENFLGADSLVFPASEELGQPRYRVTDIASDLYALRSAIAHGKQIPDKYWQPTTFEGISGRPIEGFYGGPLYRDLLSGCALFLLCASLRKIFDEELVGTVADPKLWRDRLDHGISSCM